MQHFYRDFFHGGESSEDCGTGCMDWNFVGVRGTFLEESIRGHFPVWRVRDEEMEALSEDVWADSDAEYEVPG